MAIGAGCTAYFGPVQPSTTQRESTLIGTFLCLRLRDSLDTIPISTRGSINRRLPSTGRPSSQSAAMGICGLLYMCLAVVASQHDPIITAFYERLLEKGKTPLQALVAIMGQLLHGIIGMLKTGTGFDAQRLFPNIRVEGV